MGHTESHKQTNFTIMNRYKYENATCQIYALYSLLYKILTLIKAYLSPFWKSGDPLASELCFSSSWTTIHGFLDSHICHNFLVSDLDILQTWRDGSQRDLGPNCNVDGFKVANYSSESSPCTVSCVGLCTVTLHSTCHTEHDEASEASESNEQHW